MSGLGQRYSVRVSDEGPFRAGWLANYKMLLSDTEKNGGLQSDNNDSDNT